MSVATLKKKTNQSYRVVSTGVPTFSLNGTHRSQGYVGQTSLSRSLPKTLMKGNVACGHGGHNGSYLITPIVQSAVISLNNPNVVKSSVVNTLGMINTKYRWIRRPEPYSVVKPDNTMNSNTQTDYITYLKKKTIAKILDSNFIVLNGVSTQVVNNNYNKSCCTLSSSDFNSIFKSNLHPHKYKSISNTVRNNNHTYSNSYNDDYLVKFNASCNSCNTNETFFVANNHCVCCCSS
jgi:hypothetical protein